MGAISRCNFRASTLIEAIVASIIFLLVFAISLQTITRLTVGGNDTAIYVDVDYAMKSCFRDFANGRQECGSHIKTYSWGEVSVVIGQYKNYMNLQEVTIEAKITSDHKRIEYRYIIESADD